MTEQENLNIFWKALAMELRKRYPKEEFLEDFGNLHDDVLALWRHASRADWWAFGPGLNWTVEQLGIVAHKIGNGFKFQIVDNLIDTHDWKKSLLAGEAITDLVHVVNPNCVVCKDANLIAIEMLMAKGVPIRRLADTLKISERMLKLHRDYCMAERFDRVQAQLGLALDLEVLLGGAAKLDRAFKKAEEWGDKAMDKGETGAALQFGHLMKDTAMLTAELSREKPEAPIAAGGGMMLGGSPGSVNVIMMPVGERKPPKIIDGTVIEGD